MHISKIIVNNVSIEFRRRECEIRPGASIGARNRVLIYRMNKFNSDKGG